MPAELSLPGTSGSAAGGPLSSNVRRHTHHRHAPGALQSAIMQFWFGLAVLAALAFFLWNKLGPGPTFLMGVVAFVAFNVYDQWATKRAREEHLRLEQEKAAAEQAAREAQRAARLARIGQLRARLGRQVAELATIEAEAANRVKFAEGEFSDGAYSPFWDAVESALTPLSDYDQKLTEIGETVSLLEQETRASGQPLSSSTELANIPAALQPAVALKFVIRRAQRDPHFSEIYEIRRTNSILIAGFGTLAAAIDGLGAKIDKLIKEIKDKKWGDDDDDRQG